MSKINCMKISINKIILKEIWERKIKANDIVVISNCHEFETHSQSLYPQVSM